MSSWDALFYNAATMFETRGSFKGFDIMVIDPMHIFGDTTVAYEMCEFGSIINNIKNMAGLDYAAVVDTMTRQLLVIFLESPEAREEIGKMKDAAECAVKVKEDFDKKEKEKKKKEEEEEWEEFGGDEENQPDSSTWDTDDDQSFSFAADTGVSLTAEESGKAAVACFGVLD